MLGEIPKKEQIENDDLYRQGGVMLRNKWLLTMTVAGLFGLILLARPTRVGATTPLINGTPVTGSCNTQDLSWANGLGCTISFYTAPPSFNKCLYIYDIAVSAELAGGYVTLIADKAEGAPWQRNVLSINLGDPIFHEDFQSPWVIGSSRNKNFWWDGKLDLAVFSPSGSGPTSVLITGLVGFCPDQTDPGAICH